MKPHRDKFKINKALASKILAVIKPGLTKGLGNPKPGEFCIMAAFNYALGRPHRDSGLEDCVGSAVRLFDIALNDCNWSSDKARAQGMRREAIAKLGSNQIDQKEFTERLCVKGVNRILPAIFQLLAKRKDCKEPDKFNAHALECAQAKGLTSARAAAKSASAYASAYAYAYASASASADASASAYADAYASASADASASAYADAYASASASASAYAYAYASASASASASAYAYAYADADEINKLGKDYMLNLIAECAVEVLIEMKSPGTKWLCLCK